MSVFSFFERMLTQPDLMMRMSNALGYADRIAELPDAARVMRRAALRCNTCAQPEACAGWLDENKTAKEAPAYCRNHDLFARMDDRIEAEKRVA
jgi:hypothetical protein